MAVRLVLYISLGLHEILRATDQILRTPHSFLFKIQVLKQLKQNVTYFVCIRYWTVVSPSAGKTENFKTNT